MIAMPETKQELLDELYKAFNRIDRLELRIVELEIQLEDCNARLPKV